MHASLRGTKAERRAVLLALAAIVVPSVPAAAEPAGDGAPSPNSQPAALSDPTGKALVREELLAAEASVPTEAKLPAPETVAAVTKANETPPANGAELLAAVTRDVENRRVLGFNADPDYVRSLYNDPVGTNRQFQLLLLTNEEEREYEIRQRIQIDTATSISLRVGRSDELLDSWAGSYPDPATGDLNVLVASTDEAVLDLYRAIISDEPLGDRVHLRSVSQPLSRLRLLQQKISESGILKGNFSLHVDFPANRLVLGVEQPAANGELLEGLRLIDPRAPEEVAIEYGNRTETADTHFDDNANDWFGGHGYGFNNSAGGQYDCSNSIPLVQQGAPNGSAFYLTAAHCFNGFGIPDSAKTYHGGIIRTPRAWQGQGQGQGFSGSQGWELAAQKMVPGIDGVEPFILADPNIGSGWWIRSVIHETQNGSRWRVGATTGAKVVIIEDANATIGFDMGFRDDNTAYGNVTFNQMIMTGDQNVTQGGDSGGVLFRSPAGGIAEAVGSTTGLERNIFGDPFRSYYGQLSRVTSFGNAFGVTWFVLVCGC